MLLEMATLTAIQDVMEHLQVQFPGEVIEASISNKVGMIFGKLFSSQNILISWYGLCNQFFNGA